MIVIGGFFVLRSVATEEAERDIRERVVVEGQLVATALTAGVLRGDADALEAVDDLVRATGGRGAVCTVTSVTN